MYGPLAVAPYGLPSCLLEILTPAVVVQFPCLDGPDSSTIIGFLTDFTCFLHIDMLRCGFDGRIDPFDLAIIVITAKDNKERASTHLQTPSTWPNAPNSHMSTRPHYKA